MATRRKDPRFSNAPNGALAGAEPTPSVPAVSDLGENSASELIEAPQKPGRHTLDAHDFADGGGGGGGEAFSRKKVKR